VRLEPGLTLEDLQHEDVTTFVIGRMKPGGPFVVRHESDALRGWDYSTDKDFAGKMLLQEKKAIRQALQTAFQVLGISEQQLREKLVPKGWHLRFERRSLNRFKTQRIPETATILLHKSILDKPNGLALAMTDEIRHILTDDEDEDNTEPSLRAYLAETGVAGLKKALQELATKNSILQLIDQLCAQHPAPISDLHDTVAKQISTALLKERGPAVSLQKHLREVLEKGAA